VNGGELYLTFTEPLQRLGLRYMVTGSVASSSYGEPRFTHDIDLVLVLPPASLEPFARAFPDSEFYCPPIEVLREELEREREGHFNLIHHGSGFKADVYLVAGDPLHRWALARRVRIAVLPGRELWLAPPEYVILRKLEAHSQHESERHLRDVRAMLEVSGDDIDRAALEEWAGRLGLTELWTRVAGGGE
jgi:hypothetical protein